MSAHTVVPSDRVAELVMSAVTALGATPAPVLAPTGVPVRDGRLHLGRLRMMFDGCDDLAVIVGFATAAWIGLPGVAPPELGRLTYRACTSVDARGRVALDVRARRWLAVDDPSSLDVVTVPTPAGGLLVVPVVDFARRWAAVGMP